MLTNDQANVLISFWYGADLSQVDLAHADAIAKAGLVAWTVTPFRNEAFVTVEGEDALVEWLADDDLARWMGLLPAITVRSGSLPEMNVSVRLFDEGAEARRNGDRGKYLQACRANDEDCAWAGPWLRGWNAAGAEVAA